MTLLVFMLPREVWSITSGNISGYAATTNISSGTTPSGVLTSPLPALLSALLTTTHLWRVSKVDHFTRHQVAPFVSEFIMSGAFREIKRPTNALDA